MKKNNLPMAVTMLFATGLVFSVVPTAQATVGTFQQNSEIRQENRQERRVEFAENVQERQDNRQERRDDFAQVHANRLTKRFGFYYERLSTIQGKIESRLATVSAEGKDVSAAQAKLDEAKTALSSAKSYSDQAIAGFEAIAPAEYEAQRTQALAARDLAMKARDQFKLAVSLMREAVKLAKQA